MSYHSRSKRWILVIGLLVGMKVDATGIPVVDVLAIVQSTLSAMENVAQTIKQIEEHRTQLQQYENQLQNTLTLDNFEWSEATQTIRRLINAIDTLEHHRSVAGSIQEYLKKYRDLNFYRTLPCFAIDGCRSEMEAINANGAEAQKRANDAVVIGIDAQQTQLVVDAVKLTALQSNTETAHGQMEALQYANQFASHQAAQLLQIRGLLVQQQASSVAYYQTLSANESLQHAGDEKARAGEFKASTIKSY